MTSRTRTAEESVRIIQEASDTMVEVRRLYDARHPDTLKVRIHAEALLKDRSMHDIRPVLMDFPFMGSAPILDVFQMFSLEPMHVLHLGLSKMLKNCALERLKSIDRTTTKWYTPGPASRTFNSIRTRLIRQLNKFVEKTTIECDGVRLGLYLINVDGKYGLNGLFNREGITGMLEACDMIKIDMISLFFGALLDRACDEVQECPMTTMFTDYVDMKDDICGTWKRDKWEEADVSLLKSKIQTFKTNGKTIFGDFQKSGMCTVKWHVLDHVCEDIQRNGSIYQTSAELYEYAHSVFKRSYDRTSKRRASAMDESIEKLNNALNQGTDIMRGVKRKLEATDGALRSEEVQHLATPWPEVCNNDTVRSSKPFMKLNIGTFLSTRSSSTLISQGKKINRLQGMAHISDDMVSYLQAIGYEAHLVLCELLHELLEEEFGVTARPHALSLHFSRSAYVSGLRCPTARDIGTSGKVMLQEGNRRVLQWVFATHNYYNYGKPRFDSVMLHAGERSCGGVTKSEIWFGKVLSIFKVKTHQQKRPGTDLCVDHNASGCDICNAEDRDYVFVRYYELLGKDKVPMDAVDQKLNCVRLIWERYGHRDGEKGLGNEYALCPLDSVRGLVHLVCADEILECVSNGVDYKASITRSIGADARDTWEDEVYYVNRFFHGQGQIVEVEDDIQSPE